MKKPKQYIVVQISKKLGERKIGKFEGPSDRYAKARFYKWFPNGNGSLRYKLYKLVSLAK